MTKYSTVASAFCAFQWKAACPTPFITTVRQSLQKGLTESSLLEKRKMGAEKTKIDFSREMIEWMHNDNQRETRMKDTFSIAKRAESR